MAEIDRGDDFTPNDVDPEELQKTLAEDEDLEVPETKDEEEEKVEPKEEEEEKKEEEKPRSKYIPRIRFDKAQEKAKAREERLQQELEDLRKQVGGQRQNVGLDDLRAAISQAQDAYEDFLMDGKKAEAKTARQELESLQEMLIETKANTSSQAAKAAAVEELKYDAALARYESAHPVLNPDSEDYSEETTDEVALVLEAFIARGFTRHAALDRAVKYVVGNQHSKKDDDAVVTAALKEQKAAAARTKNADAAKKTPPSMSKVGSNSDKAGKSGDDVDVMRLSQEKFAKLDEDTLRKLRGDDL